jgi:hypothetical protein
MAGRLTVERGDVALTRATVSLTSLRYFDRQGCTTVRHISSVDQLQSDSQPADSGRETNAVLARNRSKHVSRHF